MDLKKMLAGAQLPALPQSAVRLLKLSQDPNNGPAEFAAAIEADPGLASQVLRFVNSSYFSFSGKISDIKHGITLVGTRTVKSFTLWNAVFSLLPNPQCGPFDLRGLWQDSLRRALFARSVGRLLGIKEGEEVFTAALLQDMAVPLLAKESPGAYAKLLQARNQGRNRLSALEQRVFGWTHAQAAGIMARQWNFPEEFALLVEGHLKVDDCAADPRAEPGKLAVALSALLPSIADPSWIECGELDGHYNEIGWTEHPPLETLLEEIDAEFRDLAPLLRIAMPGKSLRDSLREATSAV
jgi:HD-like signal output (HDOD) protein